MGVPSSASGTEDGTMTHVVLAHVSDAKASVFPPLAGVSLSGNVTTTPIVTGSDRPLFLWQHQIAPHGTLRWQRPAQGHVAYVWHGGVTVNDRPLGEDGML